MENPHIAVIGTPLQQMPNDNVPLGLDDGDWPLPPFFHLVLMGRCR